MRRQCRSVAIAILCGLLGSASARAATLHVPGDYPTIQSCIDAAISGQDECVVAPGTYNELINFLGKAITLRSSHGPALTTIDGTALNGSVISCRNAEVSDTILKGFSITGGTGTTLFPNETAGGGMYNANSSPTVINCVFSRNTAGHGGGIYNADSIPTLNDCTFSENSSTFRGGGMYNERSSPTLGNCTFSNNNSSSGGGMFNYYGSPTLVDCSFIANTGSFGGGGIFNRGSSPSLTGCMLVENTGTGGGGGMLNQEDSTPALSNCLFSGNQAPSGAGGGIHNGTSNSTLNDCVLTGNSAATLGGGLYNDGNLALTACEFSRNTANFGGGLYNDFGVLNLSGCEFTQNAAAYAGGGVYTIRSRPLIQYSVFKLNDAVTGGGIYNGGAPAIEACYFGGNHAQHGGGIFNGVGSETEILDCTFEGNVAFDEGAGIFNHQSKSRVRRCDFHLNQAIVGAGLRNLYSTVDIVDCDFEDNTAYESGAGIANGEGPGSIVQFGKSELRPTFDFYTVTRGAFRANESYKNDPSHGGGAIYDNARATIISGVAFEHNIASGCGGAVMNVSNGLTVRRCLFVANGAGHQGGALHGGGEIDDCFFEANSAPVGNGGAIAARSAYDWKVANSTFIANSAAYGGATHGPGELRQCTFLYNQAVYAGGATHSPTVLSHSYLAANKVTLAGGAVYTNRSTRLLNSVLVGNEGNSGGAIYNDYNLSVFNCTIANNFARGYGGAIANQEIDKPAHSLSVTNSIIRGNTASVSGEQIWSGSKPFGTTIFFSNVEGSGGSTEWDFSLGADGGGNLDVNPEFTRDPNDGSDGWGDDPATIHVDESLNDDFGDLRFRPGSPCINAGDPGYPSMQADTDLDGHARVLCGRIDMGAYEFGIGDFDCDQSITLNDWAAVESCSTDLGISYAPGCKALDFEYDFDVDLRDLAAWQNLLGQP